LSGLLYCDNASAAAATRAFLPLLTTQIIVHNTKLCLKPKSGRSCYEYLFGKRLFEGTILLFTYLRNASNNDLTVFGSRPKSEFSTETLLENRDHESFDGFQREAVKRQPRIQ
jgi:hypothetical protein